MYRGALHISLSYSIKKGYLSQTANLFVNLKSNTMKNTLQRYSIGSRSDLEQTRKKKRTGCPIVDTLFFYNLLIMKLLNSGIPIDSYSTENNLKKDCIPVQLKFK